MFIVAKGKKPMRKLLLLFCLLFFLQGCSSLTKLSAFTQCEFRLYGLSEPLLCGIDLSHKRSWRDFSLSEGQRIALYLLGSHLPFDVTAIVEVRNPGSTTAAVNAIQWKLKVDKTRLAMGSVNEPVEVAPSGGRVLVEVPVHADLIDLLEGDNPQTMMNFVLNMLNSGQQSSELSLQLKPSIAVGSRSVRYPGYFTISREFSSGY